MVQEEELDPADDESGRTPEWIGGSSSTPEWMERSSSTLASSGERFFSTPEPFVEETSTLAGQTF